jgi:hypothetical protein
MVVLNDMDRFHLVADVIDRVRRSCGARAAYAKQAIRDKLIEHKQYIARYGEDMPEIQEWRWAGNGKKGSGPGAITAAELLRHAGGRAGGLRDPPRRDGVEPDRAGIRARRTFR